VVAVLVASSAAAVPPGSHAAAESLALCNRADSLLGDEREQLLARGMALAEGALSADALDARAHFAAVCNLGKQMEAAGIGLGQLVSLRRLRRELDATLELAPGDADTLVAKGALLLHLPRLLGGDVAEAEGLLRRALAAEPDNGTARCYLAQALSARGAEDEARALAPHC
jgi:thioredoxin-like negative regulator of GroEL